MKTKLLFLLLLLGLNGSVAIYASESSNPITPARTENKISDIEAARINRRVEEIRAMDKTRLSASERKELRKELRGYKERIKRDGTVIYIGAGTLLIILLVLLLI